MTKISETTFLFRVVLGFAKQKEAKLETIGLGWVVLVWFLKCVVCAIPCAQPYILLCWL
jgi:hypothetical protein